MSRRWISTCCHGDTPAYGHKNLLNLRSMKKDRVLSSGPERHRALVDQDQDQDEHQDQGQHQDQDQDHDQGQHQDQD